MPKDTQALVNQETVKDNPEARRSKELLWDSGEIVEPGNGYIHMGSFAVHIFGRDNMGTKKEFQFTEYTLASTDIVPEELADLAWKSLGNRIMAKYGRKQKFLGVEKK